MSKRKYTHVKELLPIIEAMKAQGMTFREIAESCGLEDVFYASLGEKSGVPVRCGLRYFEKAE